MTAHHPDHTTIDRPGELPGQPQRVPFHRLVLVETRKLFDTRSSKILTAIVPALTVAAVVARAVTIRADLHTLIGTASVGYILLPVIAILTVTGEWSHRTALTTFTLEPRRLRALAAKSVPALGLGVVATAFAVLVAAPVTAVAGAQDAWNVTPLALLGLTAMNVISLCQGMALGLLLLNAPVAIVIYLLSPMVWAFVAQAGDAGASVASWLDLGTTTAPLWSGGWTGLGAAQLAVSMVFWLVLPATLGAVRVLRKEVH
ncbi:ABC transporter permease [Nonomuraea sp. K274]|uniref:ABC transporter permease n=1 Tax=Nonomuraea cypriaca TaxID=1187855 RepID=A0A931ABC1_9ACTN|nr:ABC transporter permease [Nonomuraea cypriaca]MBF8186212.1 ABC transporter permease [Nonomuraea cypriaca]